MNIIVVGCGRLGADLAYRLSQRPDIRMAVVDINPLAFIKLPDDYRGRIIEGDALARDTLERAGIEHADALAAVTDSDALNAVVGHVARSVFNVPVVVARNFDPDTLELYEIFGLQVVSATSWGSQRIEEMLHHGEMRAVFSSGNGEVEIYEVVVPERWHGRQLRELIDSDDVLPTAVTRGGRAFLPAFHTVLEKGDILQVSALMGGIERLRNRLFATEEG